MRVFFKLELVTDTNICYNIICIYKWSLSPTGIFRIVIYIQYILHIYIICNLYINNNKLKSFFIIYIIFVYLRKIY